MTTNNMGTPGNPESVSHWANKVMYRQKLEQFRKLQRGFWVFFNNCCGSCEAGWYVENILKDVTKVEAECNYGPFRPDIVLWKGDTPSIIVEIVATSLPSQDKIDYFLKRGIDIIEISGNQRPEDSFIANLHISPSNCRKRKRDRLNSLWRHLVELEDPRIGIKEDFRTEERKNRERREREERAAHIRQEIREGKLRCQRCDGEFEHSENGFSFSQIWKHSRGDSTCGLIPFCYQCSFEVRGGWKSELPEDADQWGISEDCPDCQAYISQQFPSFYQPPPSLLMPGKNFSRVVSPPRQRTQHFVVGEKSVSREELQAIAMRFKAGLMGAAEGLGMTADPLVNRMIESVEEILKAVLYPNNILEWDWLEGVGESYLSESMDTGNIQGDKFFYPKRWGWEPLC